MLIPDLLNTLFDQSDYSTLMTLCALNRRKTTYALKYSLLIHYDIFDNMFIKNINPISYKNEQIIRTICSVGKLKTIKHIATTPRTINIAYIYSAEHGHFNAVKYLIGLGANLNFTCLCMSVRMGMGAYLRCARNGKLSMMKYLEHHGVYHGSCSEMRFSARYGHLNVVKYLIGIYLNMPIERACNMIYITTIGDAMVECAKNGHLEIVKCLMNAGNEVPRVRRYYVEAYIPRALSNAIDNGHTDIVNFINNFGLQQTK